MKKIKILLSGGVDSSVAALQLKMQGYEVSGVYLKCWSQTQLKALGLPDRLYACNWEDDLIDAETVSKKIGIDFKVIDLQNQYRKNVIAYMINQYRSGQTPNPDVMCNSTIKFGVFADQFFDPKTELLASGHYARQSILKKTNSSQTRSVILRAKDLNKDQTYFLWKIRSKFLEYLRLPVGEFNSKSELRKFAKEQGLITAEKKDSQGLCFVGKTPLRELLLEAIGSQPGDIVDSRGKILGKHPGAFLYTIGQREKLGLAGGPWYVYKTDLINNLVYVLHQNQKSRLNSTRVEIEQTNWFINPQEFEDFNLLKFQAQVRYRQLPTDCSLIKTADGKFLVEFKKPVPAPTPGQSLVLYSDEILIGGGVISKID